MASEWFLWQTLQGQSLFLKKEPKMLQLRPCVEKDQIFFCGSNRQREQQTSRQDNSICAEARLKFFPFSLNCLILVLFSKLLKSLLWKFPRALETADTKLWRSSTKVTTDTKMLSSSIWWLLRPKKGQRDFFRQLLRPRTKTKRRLSYPNQEAYLRERI